MRHADFAADGCDVSDSSIAAMHHVGQHRERGVDLCPEHHLHGFFEIGESLGFNRPNGDDARIIDENIDDAKTLDHLAHHRIHFLLLPDVTNNGHDFGTGACEFLVGPFQGVGVPCAEYNFASLCGEFLCDGEAKSARAAGDERDLSAEISHAHVVQEFLGTVAEGESRGSAGYGESGCSDGELSATWQSHNSSV